MKTDSNIISVGDSFSKKFNFVSAGCAYNTGTRGIPFLTKFNMSQMNPKEVFHNTANSVQLPYTAGHSL